MTSQCLNCVCRVNLKPSAHIIPLYLPVNDTETKLNARTLAFNQQREDAVLSIGDAHLKHYYTHYHYAPASSMSSYVKCYT